MSIIDDLIDSLETDAPVRDVRIGAYWTAVVVEKGDRMQGGLASTLRDEAHHHEKRPPVREAGRLLELSALDLAALARSDSLVEASVGMAAINALLEVDETACTALNAREVIIEHGAGKRVAIVGHFPFIPRVRQAVEKLWVLEQRPRGDDLPAERAPEIIPQADVVAITGTSLINHTFEELIGLCCPEAFVLVLGPTTPLSPVLFDYGADVISGTLVTDPETVLRYVSQGASFRQIKRSKGVKLLTLTKEALQK
ncbi:MAG: Rossmann-like domain-containing protein [Anaerolineae bacterium]